MMITAGSSRRIIVPPLLSLATTAMMPWAGRAHSTPMASDHEHQRGRQRHRDLRADAVERAQAVGVAHQREQRRHRRAQRQQLRRPAEAAQRPVDDHQGRAEQQEVDRRVRRHLVRPRRSRRSGACIVEEQPIDAGVVEAGDRQHPRARRGARSGRGERDRQPARQSPGSDCVAISPSAQPLQMNPTAVAGFVAVSPGMKRFSASTSRLQPINTRTPISVARTLDEAAIVRSVCDEPRHQELVVRVRVGRHVQPEIARSPAAIRQSGYRTVSG